MFIYFFVSSKYTENDLIRYTKAWSNRKKTSIPHNFIKWIHVKSTWFFESQLQLMQLFLRLNCYSNGQKKKTIKMNSTLSIETDKNVKMLDKFNVTSIYLLFIVSYNWKFRCFLFRFYFNSYWMNCPSQLCPSMFISRQTTKQSTQFKYMLKLFE